mgnify:CR=1 FL=1
MDAVAFMVIEVLTLSRGIPSNSNSISATGNIASFSVNGREMILTGNVLLTNEMSMIKGNKLILNIDTGKIEIFNDELNQERVKGILVEEKE